MMGPVADGWWHWGMGVGWVFMLAFWVLVIIAIVAAVRWALQRGGVGDRGDSGDSGDSALRLLRERYARGEINREEFQRMRQDLEDDND